MLETPATPGSRAVAGLARLRLDVGQAENCPHRCFTVFLTFDSGR